MKFAKLFIIAALVAVPSLCFSGQTKVSGTDIDPNAKLAPAQVVTPGNVGASNVTASSGSFNTVDQSSGVYEAISAPLGISGKGVMYYDSSAQSMKVINNNGTAMAIPDPPGAWSCVVRTYSTGSCGTGNGCAFSVSCVGNEKAINGGCTARGNNGGNPVYYSVAVTQYPLNQGWECEFGYNASYTFYGVWANCCL